MQPGRVPAEGLGCKLGYGGIQVLFGRKGMLRYPPPVTITFADDQVYYLTGVHISDRLPHLDEFSRLSDAEEHEKCPVPPAFSPLPESRSLYHGPRACRPSPPGLCPHGRLSLRGIRPSSACFYLCFICDFQTIGTEKRTQKSNLIMVMVIMAT